jgi:hypothetical protein
MLGFDRLIEERLKETGWDQLIQFQFKRQRDFDLPVNLPDQEVWQFVQAQQFCSSPAIATMRMTLR